MIPFKDRLLKKKIKKREEVKMILMKNKGILKDNNRPLDDKVKESPMESSEDTTKSPPKKRKKLNKKNISAGNFFEVSNLDEQTHLVNEENEAEYEFEQSSDSLFGEESYNNKVSDRIISHEILSNSPFSSLEGKVSVETLKAIEEMGFTKMTEIQARTIPPLLEGKNLAGNAKTGSGKTLAFLIPAVELITKLKYKPRNGAGCIIISPTRELAMQTFGVLQELMKYHKNTYGLVIGGAHRETEARKLQNGMNIIVATPGRLVDHLQNTQYFVTKNLINLVIDEADRILEIGFEEKMRHILNILPKQRQTVLFSATTRKTEDLIKIAFNGPPLCIGLHDNLEKATVEGLDQGYLVVPSEKRFLVLFKFLKKCQKKKKVMVFFSTCLTVVFYDMLLNYIDIPVMSIHGKQKQSKRTSTFFKFSNAEKGILLCTDVAARGLDIPAVDWIIQYDPPEDTKEYIHRVGRTARGEGGSGRAMLYLRPEELGFLTYLHEAKVPLNEYDYNWSKVSDIHLQLEKLVGGNYALRVAAKEGFTACVRSYYSHRLKDAFDFEKLDLDSLAKNFCLSYTPDVLLENNGDKRKRPNKKK